MNTNIRYGDESVLNSGIWIGSNLVSNSKSYHEKSMSDNDGRSGL